MAIRKISLNNCVYAGAMPINALIENNTQNDANRFAPNTVFASLPISSKNNAFLIPKPPNNKAEQKINSNNFFLSQPENQINPFTLSTNRFSPAKSLLLSSRAELVSASNPFS